MSDVHVYDLSPKDFNTYREVVKGYPTERHAGRAVFQAGLKLLTRGPAAKKAPAPSPVDTTTAETPVIPEAPPVTLAEAAPPAPAQEPAPAKKKAPAKKAPARRARA